MNNEYHSKVHEKLRDKLFVVNRRNRMIYYKNKSFSINLSKLSGNYKFVDFLWNLPTDLSKINLNSYILEENFDIFYKTANYLNRESNRKLSHFGFNNQNVIFGFLNWTRKLGSKFEVVRSPLFMTSSSICKERGKLNPFILSFEDFYFKINPVLIKVIKDEYGIDLPQNIKPSTEGVMGFFNYFDSKLARIDKMISIHSGKEVTEDVWSIDLANVTIDDISFENDAIIDNYDFAINEDFNSIEECVNDFNKLFNLKPKSIVDKGISNIDFKDDFIVVPSDKTQTDAVYRARSGESYIIQGPPGTGKSQTITNLIADSVARNKRVLFVCEKEAALNVVNDRLKEVGLDEMSVFINDTIKDKRLFINSLRKTYDKCVNYNYDYDIAGERIELANKLNSYIEYIKSHSTQDIASLLEEVIYSNNSDALAQLDNIVVYHGKALKSESLSKCISTFAIFF